MLAVTSVLTRNTIMDDDYLDDAAGSSHASDDYFAAISAPPAPAPAAVLTSTAVRNAASWRTQPPPLPPAAAKPAAADSSATAARPTGMARSRLPSRHDLVRPPPIKPKAKPPELSLEEQQDKLAEMIRLNKLSQNTLVSTHYREVRRRAAANLNHGGVTTSVRSSARPQSAPPATLAATTAEPAAGFVPVEWRRACRGPPRWGVDASRATTGAEGLGYRVSCGRQTHSSAATSKLGMFGMYGSADLGMRMRSSSSSSSSISMRHTQNSMRNSAVYQQHQQKLRDTPSARRCCGPPGCAPSSSAATLRPVSAGGGAAASASGLPRRSMSAAVVSRH